MGWNGIMEWNGEEWILVEYDYCKRCWPARPAPAGFFSVKWTFIGLTSVNIFLMTKIKYSKTFPVRRFIQKSIPSTHFSEFQPFFFDRLFAQKLKKTKKRVFSKKKKKKAAGRSIKIS